LINSLKFFIHDYAINQTVLEKLGINTWFYEHRLSE
jgi:hypothetical protein